MKNAPYPRTLEPRLLELAADFPAVFLTGPRQSGKTTLARSAFPGYRYISLEELETRRQALDDPRGFLRRLEGGRGVILDEVQNTPDLFSYLQAFLDEERGGPLILTGSQHFLLSDKINQSLAGRAAILELLPFSQAELARRDALTPEQFSDPESLREDEPASSSLDETLFRGAYPRIHHRGLEPTAWLDGYLRTYIERDVRTLSAIGNLETFSRFVRLCAGRSGQLLNASALAADAGVSQPTARSWVSILQASYVITLVRPHFENFRKRMVKTPKLYFLDTGLLCYLLGLRSPSDLDLHPLRGAIFETFVVVELLKLFLHRGRSASLYFWRDSSGREVDALLDLGTRRTPIEIKAGETALARGSTFGGLEHYLKLSDDPGAVLVYGGEENFSYKNHLVRGWRQIS